MKRGARTARSPRRREGDGARARVALASAYTVAVLFVGQRPASQIPKLEFGLGFIPVDKAAHFCMYGLLAWLVLRVSGAPRLTREGAAMALGWVMLVGATDELWQSVANRGRTGDPLDWVADLCGALGAIVAWQLVAKARARRAQVVSF